jgi:hypothetical protein
LPPNRSSSQTSPAPRRRFRPCRRRADIGIADARLGVGASAAGGSVRATARNPRGHAAAARASTTRRIGLSSPSCYAAAPAR